MESNCNIIRDILPLYAENMASDDTKAFVEEHLAGCVYCKGVLDGMKAPTEQLFKLSAAPLVELKRKLKRKRLATVGLTATLVLTVIVTGLALLTTPRYLPYSEDVLTVTEAPYGAAHLSFGEGVTGYKTDYYETDKEITIRNPVTDEVLHSKMKVYVYCVSAWTTLWDKYSVFTKSEVKNTTVAPVSGYGSLSVYYAANDNKTEDLLIYGMDALPPDAGVMTLPRLALSYYLTLAAAASAVLGVIAVLLLKFVKNPTVRLWTERVLLLPVSYMIGHLCVKGVTIATFNLQIDLLFIVIVALSVYLACLFGLSLYRMRKESGDM